MQASRVSDDTYKQPQGSYDYRYYKPTIPAKVGKKNDEYHAKEISKSDTTDAVYSYKLAEVNESDKVTVEEDISIGGYEQPTLPYYVVPVLYVPKRVLPNEEMQTAPRYTPVQQQMQPINPVTKQRYYTKSRYTTTDGYPFGGTYYNNCYDISTAVEPGNVEEDQSYYNMQYSGSSSSIKEETVAVTYQDSACNYPYVPTTKVAMNNIRPLKSQPACARQECDSKIKSKSRSAYECTRQTMLDATSCYYPDTKDIYYESLEPRRRSGSPSYDYYAYPSGTPANYYPAQCTSTKVVKPETNRTVKTPVKQTRYTTDDLELDKVVAKDDILKQALRQAEAKVMSKSTAKSIVERSTQTVSHRLESTGTQTNDEDAKEKKSMIPTSRPKERAPRVEVENIYSDEEDTKEINGALYRMKETRRSSINTLQKRPDSVYKMPESPGSRQPSPVRRQVRKF